jgi:hypothetical protein
MEQVMGTVFSIRHNEDMIEVGVLLNQQRHFIHSADVIGSGLREGLQGLVPLLQLKCELPPSTLNPVTVTQLLLGENQWYSYCRIFGKRKLRSGDMALATHRIRLRCKAKTRRSLSPHYHDIQPLILAAQQWVQQQTGWNNPDEISVTAAHLQAIEEEFLGPVVS